MEPSEKSRLPRTATGSGRAAYYAEDVEYVIAELEERNAALKRENETLKIAGNQLTSVLPDSVKHENPQFWEWCWEELDCESQDEVKSARKVWHSALLTAEEPE